MQYNKTNIYSRDWETILQLTESFDGPKYPKSKEIRQRAMRYLGHSIQDTLTRYELRHLVAKTDKLKTHNKKLERKQIHNLEKEIKYIFNFHK